MYIYIYIRVYGIQSFCVAEPLHGLNSLPWIGAAFKTRTARANHAGFGVVLQFLGDPKYPSDK